MKTIKVLSMARSKRDAKEKIEDLSLTFATHITYMIFYADSKLRKKWRNEVSGYCSYIVAYSKVRTGKGVQRLSESEILDYLYDTIWMGDSASTLEFLFREARYHNKKLKPVVDCLTLSAAHKLKVISNVRFLYTQLASSIVDQQFDRKSVEDIIDSFLSSVPTK